MRDVIVTGLLAIVLAAFIALPGEAQESADPLYLSLNESLTPRANGLSGGFAALSDDFGAGFVNPAGLSRVSRFFEGTVGVALSAGSGDASGAQKPGGVLQTPLGAALRHCAYTFGFAHRVPFELQSEADGSRARLAMWSFFGAWRPSSRLSVGLTVSESTFRSDSALGLDAPSEGGTDFSVLDEVAVSAIAGLGLELTHRDHVGIAFRSRQQWAASTEREPSEVVGLLAPARLTAAYARAVPVGGRFTLSPTAQVEWHGSAAGVSAWGLRSGVEVSIPIGRCWSGCGVLAHLRAGWAFAPGDAILHRGALPTSLDREAQGAFGASVSFDTVLPMRVDVSASEIGEGTRWSAALLVRYGVSFRDVNRR